MRKKLRIIKSRLFAVINLILSDEFILYTYDQDKNGLYDMEFKSTVKLPNDMVSIHNKEMFSVIAEQYNKKRINSIINEAKGILKCN